MSVLLAGLLAAQPPVPRRMMQPPPGVNVPVVPNSDPTMQQRPGRQGGRGPGSAAQASAPVDPAKLGKVEGQVLHALTKEPLRKATVMLRAQGGGDGRGWAAVTDEGGKFSMEGIEPGRYTLSAQRNGFLLGTYGSKRANQPGTAITLADAQSIGDLTIFLSPQGVITGRVVDEDSEPLQNVQIQVLRSQMLRGKARWMPVGGNATNDAGEYRVTGLSPGRYLILANYSRSNMMGPRVTLVGKGGNEVYSPVYHPGAAEPDSALPVEVTGGNEVRGIDFRLRKTRGYRIRGQVTNAGDPDRRLRPIQISVLPQGGMFLGGRAGTTANAQGEFEIPVVPPGSYTLVAMMFDNDAQLIGRAQVQVSGDDVEGVVVSLAPGFEVTGTITAEGNPTDFDPTKVNLNLMPAGDEGMNMGIGGGGARGEKDGKFRMPRINPNRYQVFAITRLDGYYVKAIRYGNQDVLGQEFELSGPSQLEVVLSPGAATLGGTVQDSKGNPASGALVLVAPKTAPARQDLQRVATTDQNGSFELKGLAPGEYLVFAFEDAEVGGLSEVEARKPFESKATSVKLSERGRESLQIKVIPPI